MITPDEITILTNNEYAIYYYIGIGFASGAVAGYGFALKTSLKNSTEIIEFYKTELSRVKKRVEELETRLFPGVIDRRHHDRDLED